MAAPTKIIASDVMKAANELRRVGKNINGTALRNITGTGRPENIMEMYEQLLKEGKITAIESATEVSDIVDVRELPKEVQQSLEDAVASLKNVVMHCNDIAHNTVENRLSAAIDKAKAAEVLAAEETQAAQTDLTSAYNEIEELKDEYKIDLDLLNEKRAKLDRDNSDLKTELSNTQKSYGETRTANTDLSRNLETKTKQCLLAEQESLVQKTRNEEVEKQVAAVKEVNTGLAKKLEDATTLHTNDAAEIAKLKSQLEDSNKSKEKAIKEAETHEDLANVAFKEIEKFKAQAEAAKEQVAELKVSEAQLHERLEKQAVENAENKLHIKDQALYIENLKSVLDK